MELINVIGVVISLTIVCLLWLGLLSHLASEGEMWQVWVLMVTTLLVGVGMMFI